VVYEPSQIGRIWVHSLCPGGGCLVLDEKTNEIILGCDYTNDFADFGGVSDASVQQHAAVLMFFWRQNVCLQDKDRWDTAVRETFEESLTLVDLRGGSCDSRSLGHTLVHPDDPSLVPKGGRCDDQAYKCFLVRLPPAASDRFCTRFADAAALASKPEVSVCVRFPVGNVVRAVRGRGAKTIESQKGRACSIRDRTWKVGVLAA